jgi:CspA family cold shock protein
MPRLTGTVRWFNNSKGYGFLGRDDGGADVFIHYSAIEARGYKTLREGESVTYDIINGEKGLQADKVVPLRSIPAGTPANAAPSRRTVDASVRSSSSLTASARSRSPSPSPVPSSHPASAQAAPESP